MTYCSKACAGHLVNDLLGERCQWRFVATITDRPWPNPDTGVRGIIRDSKLLRVLFGVCRDGQSFLLVRSRPGHNG